MGQELVTSPLLDPRAAERRRVRMPVAEAASRDHAAIYCFLQSVMQGPPREEFNASLEDPFYEPCDRLLLRRPPQIVGHVRVTHRAMHLGALTVSTAGLEGFAIAPEHRNRGLGSHLLRAAESRMLADGALVGTLRTGTPHFFRRSGWALCEGASYRRATARALLARLLDHGAIPRPRRRLHIRPLLKWDHDALARIYQQNLRPQPDKTVYGPLERTPAYWRWLLNRHAYDEVFVALEGPEQLELGEISTHIVGYAVTRGEQIVELMASPDCPRAATELLVRCCGDAIERDRLCVALHGPPACPLFGMFDEAGGSGPPHPPDRGEVQMMRLVDATELLRRLSDELDRRASEAGLRRPLELGLLVDGQKYQIELGREGPAVASQRMGRSYLRLNVADFTRLVLGQLDWDAAIADGRLECSTALAREIGPALFPRVPFWRPPWDDMTATRQND